MLDPASITKEDPQVQQIELRESDMPVSSAANSSRN